jgi:8-oxo-dGTP diphosphatase
VGSRAGPTHVSIGLELGTENMSIDADCAAHSWDGFAESVVEPGVLHLAAAILVYDHRVLVVRRSLTERFLPCVWGVPCGKIDSGEAAHQAAIRELREETGLAGKVVRYVGQSVFHSVWRGRPLRNVQRNFLVHPLGVPGEVRLPKDDQESAWLSRDEIPHFAGLDLYNLQVLRQWLALYDQDSDLDQADASSADIVSSRNL